jgi:alpha-mannosidase
LKEYLDGLDKLLLKWESFYPDNIIEPVVPVLSSTDMMAPFDFSGLEKQLKENVVGKIYTENGIIQQTIPTPEYATSQKALDRLMNTKPKLPVICGERPNVWLYIHGPTHHKAVTACREAAVFLPAAEKFNIVSCLLKKAMTDYPANALREGWEGQVYPDHGWGGYNGQLTDNLFRKKFKLARDTGEKYLSKALKQIAAQINTDFNKGKPLVIFNDLSWTRTDAVRQELTFGFGEAFSIALKDGAGKDVPHQIIASELNADGSLKSAEISFIAKDIPSIGYKMYFVQTSAKKLSLQSAAKTPENFENEFYKISFAAGGIKQIFDKQANKNLLATDKFLAGEIFTMRSQGHGAGEFAEIQQPTMEGFDKVSNYKPDWELSASGPVCDMFTLEQKLKHCTIKQAVTIYHSIKQIDFETEIIDWDGTEYREFRQAFPLDMEGGEIAYEVAFGRVRVGKDEIDGAAGERYIQSCSEVHPREVQNWISVGNNDFSVTLSSDVAVCDWIDPTDNPVKYPVLQPVLLASRRSCHGYGNWYLQQGDHSYRFSLFSETNKAQGYRKATAVNHPLQTVLLSPSTARKKELSMEFSFVSCDKPNVVISTIKKCEDDDNIILRCYETEGKDTDATITFFRPFKSAEHTNIIEEEGTEIQLIKGQLKVHLGHNAIETFKLKVI